MVAWGETVNGTTSRSVVMIGDLPCDPAWVGTSGVVVCMYADGNSGAIDWARWDSTNGWVLQSDVSVSGKGETESVVLRSSAAGNLMAVFSDSSLSLWAATYSGSTWTVTGGGTALIITGISSFMSRAFDIAVK